MKRILAALLLLAFVLGGCSFRPESARISEVNDGEGWGIDDEDDASDGGDGSTATDVGDGGHDGTDAADVEDLDAEDLDAEDLDAEDLDAEDLDAEDLDAEESDAEESDADADSLQSCDGEVVDTSSDPNHCGGCGQQCDPEFGSCNGGVCACSDGLENCEVENRCEDLENDSLNCGGCGVECMPGEFCHGGQCRCRPGLTLCDGECVNTDIDPNHCGGCGASCGFGHCASGDCGSGGCGFQGFPCEQGDGLACMGLGSQSALHCAPEFGNACGSVCGGDQVCVRSGFNRGCRDFRPARGCQQCPCADCGAGETCIDDISGIDAAFCVSQSG